MMCSKANQDIRDVLKQSQIPFWMLGKEIGVCEQTIIRWLRTELPIGKREMIFKAIENIKSREQLEG